MAMAALIAFAALYLALVVWLFWTTYRLFAVGQESIFLGLGKIGRAHV